MFYHDKTKRTCAFHEIVQLFKIVDPQASQEMVQKLSSVRGSYNNLLFTFTKAIVLHQRNILEHVGV